MQIGAQIFKWLRLVFWPRPLFLPANCATPTGPGQRTCCLWALLIGHHGQTCGCIKQWLPHNFNEFHQKPNWQFNLLPSVVFSGTAPLSQYLALFLKLYEAKSHLHFCENSISARSSDMIDTPGARRLNDSRGSGLRVVVGMSMSLPRPLSAGVKTTPRVCDISGHVQQLVATHGRSPQTDMPMETGHAKQPGTKNNATNGQGKRRITSSSRHVAAYKVV